MRAAYKRELPALVERIAFDQPVSAPDGYGGVIDGWAEFAQVPASFQFLRGGETVQAARLQGRQPVVIRVRRSPTADAVQTAWRIRDLRTETVYNIRSIVRASDRLWLEITAESGVPA